MSGEAVLILMGIAALAIVGEGILEAAIKYRARNKTERTKAP